MHDQVTYSCSSPFPSPPHRAGPAAPTRKRTWQGPSPRPSVSASDDRIGVRQRSQCDVLRSRASGQTLSLDRNESLMCGGTDPMGGRRRVDAERFGRCRPAQDLGQLHRRAIGSACSGIAKRATTPPAPTRDRGVPSRRSAGSAGFHQEGACHFRVRLRTPTQVLPRRRFAPACPRISAWSRLGAPVSVRSARLSGCGR